VLPTPAISGLSPTFGLVGASVTITGTNFGSTQGSSTVKFNGTTATPTNWSATSITAPVPAGATSGNVVVTVSGVASAGVNFNVGTSALAISASALPRGAINGSYSASLIASGGTAPYSWSIMQGALPSGLSLNASTGAITGTPTGSASLASFTVQVTDANASSATRQLSLRTVPILIATTSLPNGSPNVAYSASLQALGGVTPYTWSVAQGSLPAGLSLNSATGAVSGTPSAVGTNTFTVQVTDANSNTALQAYTVTIFVPVQKVASSPACANSTSAGSFSCPISQVAGNIVACAVSISANSAVQSVADDASPSNTYSAAFGTTFSSGPRVELWVSQPGAVSATNVTVTLASGSPAVVSCETFSAVQGIGNSNSNFGSSTSASVAVTPSSGNSYIAAAFAARGSAAFSGVDSGAASTGTSTVGGAIAAISSAGAPGAVAVPATLASSETWLSAGVELAGQPAPPTPVLAVSTATLPAGNQNVPYNTTLQAGGGTSPYAWAIIQGTLPAGLSLNANTGALTGEPTNTGSSSFTVQVADVNFNTATQPLALSVAVPAVQRIAASAACSNANSGLSTLSCGIANTFRNTLACAVSIAGSAQVSSVTDNASDTYSSAGSFGFIGGPRLELWISQFNAGVATSLTVTLNSPSQFAVSCDTISGIAGFGAASNTAFGSATPPNPSLTVTTAQNNDLVFAGLVAQGPAAFSGVDAGAITPIVGGAAIIATGATAGPVTLNASLASSEAWAAFGIELGTVPLPTGLPSISSLSPSSGQPGTAVTITGTNFGAGQGTNIVQFNGTTATVTSWSATIIVATVPNGATTGNVAVIVSGFSSNGVNFVVPLVTSITVSPQTLTLPLNSQQQMRATANYSDGSHSDVTLQATWNSSSASTATIAASGVLTTNAQGQVTIQGSLGSFTGSATVTVNGPSFTPVGSLNTARSQHTATLLPNGKVLIAGGLSVQSALSSAEIYDPSTKNFSGTGSLATPRFGHTAILLPSGKVLITGGITLDSQGNPARILTSELFDPTSGTFSATGTSPSIDADNATLLQTGKVLVVGPVSSGQPQELYDPASGTFSNTGSSLAIRSGEIAVLLNDGTVLRSGGSAGSGVGGVLATAELYDPTAATFSNTGSLNTARFQHTGTILSSGKVLVAGGLGLLNGNSTWLAQSELYDPVAKTFTNSASLAIARSVHTATLLNSGTVLVAGGIVPGATNSVPIGSAELFDPTSQTFTGAGSLGVARESHTATLLNDGTVLFVGGIGNNNGEAQTSAELYATPPPPPTSLQISPATTSMAIGDTKKFIALDQSGNQRFDVTWTVDNTSVASITSDSAPVLTALSAGSFTLTANVQGVTAQLSITVAPHFLRITPGTVNMQVGQTQQFSAVDDLGRPSLIATWTVSDTTLATIDSASSPTLTANAVGTVTITATEEGVSTQAQVTIVAAGTIAPGTALWSAPSASGFSMLQSIQAAPTGVGPDLYATQISADGTQTIIQALTVDGQQMWQTSLPALNNNSVPDGNGGLIVTENQTCKPNQSTPMSIVDLDPGTGQALWQITAQSVNGVSGPIFCYPVAPQMANRADGTIVIAADGNTSGLPELMIVNNGSVSNIPIPASSYTQSDGTVLSGYSPIGPPLVNADGNAYVEYEVRTDAFPPKITSAAVYLLTIAPDNTTTTLQLSSVTTDTNLFPGRIIPDGSGGVIATWTVAPSNPPSPPPNPLPQPYQAAHVVSGAIAATYGLPFTPSAPVFGNNPTLVLGENNTAFATDNVNANEGPKIASFDLTSGAVNWSFQASVTTSIALAGALSSQSLAARLASSAGEQFTTFDSLGNSSASSLGNQAQISWTGDLFGVQSGNFGAIAAPNFDWAASLWAAPGGSPSPSNSSVEMSWFPSLPRCQSGTPSCVMQHEAIYNALDDLIVRLSDPTVGALAQTNIFDPLKKDANGIKLTTQSFLSYLTKKRPGIYDGLRSTYCYFVLTGANSEISCFKFKYLNAAINSLVKDNFHSDISALSKAPSFPLLIFFRPSSIGLSSLGKNLGNESTIFHEALHGITGRDDDGVRSALGFTAADPSCMITVKIQTTVLSHSNGLDQTITSTCP